jgi:hypothetical protein
MTTTLRLAALAAALSLAGAASAEEASQRGVRAGVGVGLPTSELTSLFAQSGSGVTTGLLPAQIYLPIDFTPRFRLEPELGIVTASQRGGSSGSYYTVGTGAFYLMPLAQAAHLYAGGRFVVGWESGKAVGVSGPSGFTTTTKGTDLYFAGAFGGEFLPHPRIGLGAEAQVGYWSIGDRTSTTAGVSTTQNGGSSWQTLGVMFVRVYFI